MAGFRERGRAVTFVPRADFPQLWPAGSTLVIEDAAELDAGQLEAICRPPGRRIVLAASALAELPVPLTPAPVTVVTLEPLSPGTAAVLRSSMSKARVAIESGVLSSVLAELPVPLAPAPLTVVNREPPSPGTAAAPRASSRSNARVAIASSLLACVAGGLLWTRAPWTPPAPAPSRVPVLQAAGELPPAPGSPPLPPEPAPYALGQPGDETGAAAPVPRPVGDEDRPGIVTSLELPPVPVIPQIGPQSGIELAPPQLQARPSPLPESRKVRNLAPGAAIATQLQQLLDEASSAAPPEPAAPGRSAALQPTIDLPPASVSPLPPVPPEPALNAAAPVPRPVGVEDRLGIGTSLEHPAVPLVTQTEPRSDSEPAPPQLQTRPSPVPENRQALNVPPAGASATPPLADAPRVTPPSRRPRLETRPNCSPRTRRSGCWSATRAAVLRRSRRRPGSCACCATAGSQRATRRPPRASRVRPASPITSRRIATAPGA